MSSCSKKRPVASGATHKTEPLQSIIDGVATHKATGTWALRFTQSPDRWIPPVDLTEYVYIDDISFVCPCL